MNFSVNPEFISLIRSIDIRFRDCCFCNADGPMFLLYGRSTGPLHFDFRCHRCSEAIRKSVGQHGVTSEGQAE